MTGQQEQRNSAVKPSGPGALRDGKLLMACQISSSLNGALRSSRFEGSMNCDRSMVQSRGTSVPIRLSKCSKVAAAMSLGSVSTAPSTEMPWIQFFCLRYVHWR